MPVVQVMIPHTCVTHQDNLATMQYVTSVVSSTPMPSRMVCSTVSHSPFGRGWGDSGPSSTPVLAFKMPDPLAITSMPMPPSPSKKLKLQSTSNSSSIWDNFDSDSLDTEVITEHLMAISLAS